MGEGSPLAGAPELQGPLLGVCWAPAAEAQGGFCTAHITQTTVTPLPESSNCSE